jgi:Flp pilus assembly CpaE family ATPase
VIIVAAGTANEMLEEALEADVADVLLLPQLVDNVAFAVRKAAHAKRGVPTVTKAQLGRVITVFSPKGGTGKTVTAVNVAASLAKQGRRTLLLDLDLQFGDAAIVMGLEPDKTIYDLVVAPGELDIEKLAGYTSRHPCGLDVLPAPLRPEDAELVTESKITRLLEVARECYAAIVVDTSPFFHGPMLSTLDRTDELLVVCGLDVPTLKNVRLALQTLELLSFPSSRIRYVLNRANTKVGLSKHEVESALKVTVDAEVPSDRVVPISDDILGHGPIERRRHRLLADDTVSEIMVNGPFDVWVERAGRISRQLTRRLGRTASTTSRTCGAIINKIVAQVGRRIDESSPMVDARLPDGSRVNAIIPPLSLSGPLVTIRKFSKARLHSRTWSRFGTISTRRGEFLRLPFWRG